MPMMLEVEEKYQALVDAFLQVLNTVRAQQKAAGDGAPVDYRQVEQEVAQGTAALERAAHAAVLGTLDVDAPQVVIEGQTYRKVMRSLGSYYTMAGAVCVERTLYRKVGERSGATVDAISLRTGVVGDGWLALSDRYNQAIALSLAPLRKSVSPGPTPISKLSCAA